ncbi:aldehyde ferredoxin oxidoreductase C-terminal domain-containing protein, partial [Chloroflexota bacterium]
ISELTIGPAGENLVRIAKVFNDKARAGGKNGLGAVMGSKNLKAIVVRGTGSIKIANPEEFYMTAKHAYEKLRDSTPLQRSSELGTIRLIRLRTEARSLTTRNAQSGYFEGWEKVTSEAFGSQYAVRRRGCFGCPAPCTRTFEVKEGKYSTHGYANEYGTTYPFTSKIGSDNLAAALKIGTMCDQLGLDTHATGGTISFAMEAWQRGLLSAKDTDGIDLSWGNVDSVIELVPKIAYREGFGNILAEGSHGASKQIKGSEICLVEVKGAECSSFYPGPGTSVVRALAFATAPIGGSLHRGASLHRTYAGGNVPEAADYMLEIPILVKAMGEEMAKRASKRGSYDGGGIVLAIENDCNAAVNCLTCIMLGGLSPAMLGMDELARLVSTLTGVEIDGDGLVKVGERIFNIEKVFNLREGLRRKDDTLPERFFVEKTMPEGTSGVNRAQFEDMLDEYYKFRGWDHEGFPTEEKLAELNLSDIAEQLRGLRVTG